VTRRLLPGLSAATVVITASGLALAPGVGTVGAVGAATAAPTTGTTGTIGTLTVSPDGYVPGQAVSFTGDLGVTGVRDVHLQAMGNLPGDTWGDVPDSTFQTDEDGHFDFTFRAPSMVNVSYRVTDGDQATSAYVFRARPQELTVTPVGRNPDYPFYRVRPGTAYTVVVDTTPEVKGSWGTPPPFPGRTVLLQQQVDQNDWETIGKNVTDAVGRTSFIVTAPMSGTQVLRAREVRWTADGNHIGWYVSFPAFVATSRPLPVAEPPTKALHSAPTPPSAERPTASGMFGWGAKRFDYAWEAGQSLDSPPSKGDTRTGRWSATSDGTGRVVPFNGGLVLQSKFKRVGPGDRGSVVASLAGASWAHGRWEFRLQGRPWETGAQPYRFRLELVPDGSPVTTCPDESIVLADFTMGSPGMRFGVRSSSLGSVWSGTLGTQSLTENPFNVAVEVGRGHITWFLDSVPIGTVKGSQAQLGGKLVPRLSLIGSTGSEMNGAQVNSDWQRAWSLRAGTLVTDGPALTPGPYGPC
jgi:hypothetical protein